MEFADFLIQIEAILDRHHLLHEILQKIEHLDRKIEYIDNTLERIEGKINTMAIKKEQFDALFAPFLVALTKQLANEAKYQTNVGAFVAAATAAIAAGYPTDLTEEAAAVTAASTELTQSATELATAASALASAQSNLPQPPNT